MSSHAKIPILASNEETQIKSIEVIKAQLAGKSKTEPAAKRI
jgi:membrane fusion protein (multidrug efflux system)